MDECVCRWSHLLKVQPAGTFWHLAKNNDKWNGSISILGFVFFFKFATHFASFADFTWCPVLRLFLSILLLWIFYFHFDVSRFFLAHFVSHDEQSGKPLTTIHAGLCLVVDTHVHIVYILHMDCQPSQRSLAAIEEKKQSGKPYLHDQRNVNSALHLAQLFPCLITSFLENWGGHVAKCKENTKTHTPFFSSTESKRIPL